MISLILLNCHYDFSSQFISLFDHRHRHHHRHSFIHSAMKSSGAPCTPVAVPRFILDLLPGANELANDDLRCCSISCLANMFLDSRYASSSSESSPNEANESCPSNDSLPKDEPPSPKLSSSSSSSSLSRVVVGVVDPAM
mmetsp:Transcript_47147/g.115130  ORF Transcript_47147/g.115130 Transcript_47147/m.115130 type:complete len:140 (-) Transcript_47147:1239-1658(-)